jgi:hypothetical protein
MLPMTRARESRVIELMVVLLCYPPVKASIHWKSEQAPVDHNTLYWVFKDPPATEDGVS